MAKKKKGQRADGRVEIKRKMPDGNVRHFYGASRAEAEEKYRQEFFQIPLLRPYDKPAWMLVF